jgi:hypothetical protein
MIERRRCPVFVMGCPGRERTSCTISCCRPGDLPYTARACARLPGAHSALWKAILDRLENRKKIMAAWPRSKGFRRSGLDGAELTAKVLEN